MQMAWMAQRLLDYSLWTLTAGAVWGFVGLLAALCYSRARANVRVRGWLTFLAGVVQLGACTRPGAPWARWVLGYFTVVFLVGMAWTLARGLRSSRDPGLSTWLPLALAAGCQVLTASLLLQLHSTQLLPLLSLWIGLTLLALLWHGVGLCPLMLWLRLVSTESLGVFTLLVISWVNPLVVWCLQGGPLDAPDPRLLYAYLALTATSWTLRWALDRVSVACGLPG